MRKLVTALIIVPLLIIFVAFAVANRAIITVTLGSGPFAVTCTPAPADVTPSGRKTTPDRTPEVVFTICRLKLTVLPFLGSVPWAPTCVG